MVRLLAGQSSAAFTTMAESRERSEKLEKPSKPEMEENEASSEDDEDEEDLTRAAVRDRLYAGIKPTNKARKPMPILADNQILLLKEHVRLMNGLSPRMRRKQKAVCYMDSPEKTPKSNWTAKERYKHIRNYLEDRKDSEEDAFSSSCR